jgi:phosphotransferase system enzyme I (PtsI)
MVEAGRSGERILRGIPVSPGVSHGKILVLSRPSDETIVKQHVAEGEQTHQVHRLEQALVDTRHEILEVQRQVSEGLGAEDASIFDAHLLVLEDPTLIEEVSRIILEEKVTAEYAFQKVADKYTRTLSSIDDEYLRERAADMRDVTSRLLHKLVGRSEEIDLRKLARTVHHYQLRSFSRHEPALLIARWSLALPLMWAAKRRTPPSWPGQLRIPCGCRATACQPRSGQPAPMRCSTGTMG